jgi:hypothetical protein
LLGCRSRAPHDIEQPVVADEVDVVEIHLRLQLGRNEMILHDIAR